MSKHPIVHIEISTEDRHVSGKFYQDVFGWEVTDMPEMDYSTFEYEDGRGGGFNPVSDENPAGTVTIYIQTDDIEGTLEQISAHGGKVIAPKMEIPNTGWYAFFSDPTGNQIALFKGISEE